VAGLAVAEALRQEAGVLPSVRWPNDVLLAGKKACGILVESKHDAVIIGIGLNVTTSPSDLPDIATSLSAQRATQTDPRVLTGALCRRFERWYDSWTSEGFGPIRDALRPLMGLFGQVVHITAGTSRFEGTAADLDEHGKLVVRLDAGVLRAFGVGEVALLR
jgi:BirA family biotin operon repressor/biotin-[acetyl-CoA-carboxylase] ligase